MEGRSAGFTSASLSILCRAAFRPKGIDFSPKMPMALAWIIPAKNASPEPVTFTISVDRAEKEDALLFEQWMTPFAPVVK